MVTYVALLKFTDQGISKFKDTCRRAADFKASAKKLGIEVKEQYWCMGRYDGLMIFDAADDDTATAGMLSLNALNNVTTQTMRAFTAAEMNRILVKTS